MKSTTSYNYLICFPGEYYPVIFEDTAACGDAVFVTWRVWKTLTRSLELYRWLPPLIRRPFFYLIVSQIIRKNRQASAVLEDPDKPPCFILDRCFLRILELGLYDEFRKEFPGSRVVVMFTDLISKCRNYGPGISRTGGRRGADLIYSFDPADAMRYGLRFHDLPSSDFSERFLPAEEEYEILFIGKIKERREKILRIWENLTGRGFHCAFFLIGVPKAQRKAFPPGIRCCDWIPYETYLRMEARSRIILEIVQSGSTGKTLRVNEAVILGKKLLSDNPHLKTCPVYDPDNMFVFAEPEDIPDEFLRHRAGEYPVELKKKISLRTFLDDVGNDLHAVDEEK
ncbi:MAG: hypothetical protein Q4D81_11730 [Eubacteriales bacterium]|nr:hypothetical protein [Eubacteriales bacterium]